MADANGNGNGGDKTQGTATAAPPATTTAVAKAEKMDPIKNMVEQQKETWVKLLPPGLRKNLDRFMVLCVKAIKTTPALLECDRTSLLTAIAEAAELGLEPNGVLGSGYLVPYKVKGQPTAKFIPGYRGFIQLAYRCGRVLISAEVVREGDEFEYELGDNPHITHRPNPEVEEVDDNIQFAYAIAIFPDGSKQRCVMTRKQILGIKGRSQSGGSDRSPWNTNFPEMAKKCPIRRLAKYLPLQNEAWARLQEVDNQDFDEADRVIIGGAVRSSRPLDLNAAPAPAPAAAEPPRMIGQD